MKQVLTLLGVLLFCYGNAQTTTVTYTSSDAVISNPERGFYKYSSARASNYNLLNQNTLNNYRNNQNITLIFRYFYLDTFFNSPISNTYLNNMQTDFDRLRNAGLKCVVRFAYSDSSSASPLDASKSRILEHIAQLKPILEANADVIAVLQAGFIGAWGEWYYTDQAEFGGWGYNQTSLTASNYSHRRDIVNAIMNALPESRMVQIRYPKMKQQMYNTTVPLPPNQAYNTSNLARLGHHNDCFLSSANDVGTYSNMAQEHPYMQQETRYLAMGGETCAVYEPRSNCSFAVNEMAQLHWSYLNLDYHPGVIQGFQEDECFTEIQKRLGYRFELIEAEFPQATNIGGTLEVNIEMRNNGFAAPYNERNAYIVLKNISNNEVYSIPLQSDPRTWLGSEAFTISETLNLPEDITEGTYKMYLHLPDASASIASRPEFSIRFANENVWESNTGYNNLGHNVVVNQQPLSINDSERLAIGIYPVPTNNELNIEFDSIDEYNVAFYNSLGQNISLNYHISGRKMQVDTYNLSNGIYFVTFEKGQTKESRKFVIRH
ncbi:MAG: DUF4832 domain-containing protein [Flavobacteriaceae bacterium]|jgi:hypothetical protein|nr:DUF4832 domain-containing protein [Flavobacteriaceae bacterium]